jgi:dimethylhistidine N-methyltransferase
MNSFARDVREGLTRIPQRAVPPHYFYDDLGTVLFDAITHLPEYGLTRADERILETYAAAIVEGSGVPGQVAELGSGTGRKTRWILEASHAASYFPIDVSDEALRQCAAALSWNGTTIRPITATYADGLRAVARQRENAPLLVLFLGSTIGNFSRAAARTFLCEIRGILRPGDFVLLGTDLVKRECDLIAAYDDSTGVTAAFNRNLLGRMNRELGANFDLRRFRHEARWDCAEQRVEMHLVADADQTVEIPDAQLTVRFRAGDSIWTESSYKYTVESIRNLAAAAGYRTVQHWLDSQWPFAETLLEVP